MFDIRLSAQCPGQLCLVHTANEGRLAFRDLIKSKKKKRNNCALWKEKEKYSRKGVDEKRN